MTSENGFSDGSGHGDRGVRQGSDPGSITKITGEQGSPGAAFLRLERSYILAGIEKDLIDAGRIGLKRAVAQAHAGRGISAFEEGTADGELSTEAGRHGALAAPVRRRGVCTKSAPLMGQSSQPQPSCGRVDQVRQDIVRP